MRRLSIFVMAGLLFPLAAALAQDRVPKAETVLTTLRPEHPRLILLNERLDSLRSASANDTTFQRYLDQVKRHADDQLDKPPLEHKLIGPRLLSVSRECLDRIYALAFLWRWTGDDRYARAARENLLTVSAFPDWNPSHFLDTAEMSHAVGIGYDWLFATLSETDRETIKTALIEKGLKPGIAVYESGKGWPKSDFNWNNVCNGGMIAGALAIAETDPEWAQKILPYAVASMPIALKSYDPDGAWMEGPAYWGYATRYTAFGICALDTALSTDFGLSDSPGLRVTAHFPNYTTGPSGLLLNYADSGERGRRRPMSCMFWLAQKYNDDVARDAEHAVLRDGVADVGHLIWYAPPTGKPHASLELDRHFRSPVDIIVMRSAWNDPNALFVGVKAGYNQVNHGHLDLGNFELDALGVRWARDLGADDYNLLGYWDKKKGGDRWQYYRLATASHNVPMIDGAEQDANAVAKVLRFVSKPGAGIVSIDLTSAYADFASSTCRDVAIVADRKAVVVRDRFDLIKPARIAWGMTTDATIEIASDGVATLRQDGQRLLVRILSPGGASFRAESAEQEPPQAGNKGVNRLVARVDASAGKSAITVVLAPVWPDGAVESPDLGQLD